MRYNLSPTEKHISTQIGQLPTEPCLIDAKLKDGSHLIGCRVETSFTVHLEVDIYYKTSIIDPSEIVWWQYSKEV